MGNFLSSWRVRCAAAIGALVLLFSSISAFVNGIESMKDVFAWLIWVYERAHTPWLGIFVLITVGWLLSSGLKDIRRAAEQGNKKDREAALHETQIRQEALAEMEGRLMPYLRFMDDLKCLAIEECQLNELERKLAEGNRALQSSRSYIKALPSQPISTLIGPESPFAVARKIITLEGNTLGLSNPMPNWAALPHAVGRLPEDGDPGSPALYDPDKNAHYEQALSVRLSQLEKARDNLKDKIAKSREAQGYILRKLGMKHAQR